MGKPQSNSILSLLLLVLFAGGGWLLAAWIKEPQQAKAVIASTAGTSGNQPGVFAADARAALNLETVNGREIEELLARYGSGSSELHLLAAPLFDKWAAVNPTDAATSGLALCRTHTPDLLPQFLTALAAQEKCDPVKLLTPLPHGPQHDLALAALAAALGNRGHSGILQETSALTRGDRTLLLREWHRGRAQSDAPAAGASAAAMTDADDREAARAGCLLALAAAEPEAALREGANRADFPLIAAAAYRSWLPREANSAWKYTMSRTGDPRIADLCKALLQAEIPRRRLGEALPEIQSLLSRHFPAGPPVELLAVIIAALTGESTLMGQRFVESLAGATGPESLHTPATVLLFDALCLTDPAAAWRLAGAIVQKEGAKDLRDKNPWTSALSRSDATPAQRLAAGFPDFTDMTNLALHWLESDAATAISTFTAPGVQPPLQRLVIEAALSPKGTAIPLPNLLQWAGLQPAHVPHTIEAVAADRK